MLQWSLAEQVEFLWGAVRWQGWAGPILAAALLIYFVTPNLSPVSPSPSVKTGADGASRTCCSEVSVASPGPAGSDVLTSDEVSAPPRSAQVLAAPSIGHQLPASLISDFPLLRSGGWCSGVRQGPGLHLTHLASGPDLSDLQILRC